MTPDVQKQILQVLASGCARETAAASVGIWGCTLRDWLRRGARARECEKPEPGELKYLELLLAMEQVEAQQEIRDVSVVRKAGEDVITDVTIETTLPDGSVERRTEKKLVRPGDYRAKTWFLERRGARRWGFKANLNIELEGAVKRILDEANKLLNKDDYERLLAAVTSARSEDPPGESE